MGGEKRCGGMELTPTGGTPRKSRSPGRKSFRTCLEAESGCTDQIPPPVITRELCGTCLVHTKGNAALLGVGDVAGGSLAREALPRALMEAIWPKIRSLKKMPAWTCRPIQGRPPAPIY